MFPVSGGWHQVEDGNGFRDGDFEEDVAGRDLVFREFEVGEEFVEGAAGGVGEVDEGTAGGVPATGVAATAFAVE